MALRKRRCAAPYDMNPLPLARAAIRRLRYSALKNASVPVSLAIASRLSSLATAALARARTTVCSDKTTSRRPAAARSSLVARRWMPLADRHQHLLGLAPAGRTHQAAATGPHTRQIVADAEHA